MHGRSTNGKCGRLWDQCKGLGNAGNVLFCLPGSWAEAVPRLCPGCAPSLHSPSAAFSCLCWCLQPWGVALCGCCCFRQPGALPGSWLSAHCGHSESKEPPAAQSNLCWKKLCSRDPGCVECQFILGLVLILVRKCLPSPCSEGEQQTHFWSGWHRARWV